GDPMERAGLITTRPIAGDRTVVRLSLQQRRQRRVAEAVTGLVSEFLVLARQQNPRALQANGD
ncbi:MAG: hypothetical protein ABWY19_12620, partial [Marmoricola sp.]